MKKYRVTHKIKGEKVWSDDCYKYFEVIASTKKEAREKALEIINPYKRTIVSIDIIK